jgi:hypothetical protein
MNSEEILSTILEELRALRTGQNAIQADVRGLQADVRAIQNEQEWTHNQIVTLHTRIDQGFIEMRGRFNELDASVADFRKDYENHVHTITTGKVN